SYSGAGRSFSLASSPTAFVLTDDTTVTLGLSKDYMTIFGSYGNVDSTTNSNGNISIYVENISGTGTYPIDTGMFPVSDADFAYGYAAYDTYDHPTGSPSTGGTLTVVSYSALSNGTYTISGTFSFNANTAGYYPPPGNTLSWKSTVVTGSFSGTFGP
ncbi:MAG: hypothetical protein ACRDF4_01710, partial [Rhabdochlamydiaceae bacterium]